MTSLDYFKLFNKFFFLTACAFACVGVGVIVGLLLIKPWLDR